MPTLYPLRFDPIFRRYLWGGRKLATELGKPIGDEETCAESWELCDLPEDQTLVAHGSLAGQSLGQIVRDHGEELFGRTGTLEKFPLLVKFLDARHALSVQVHPNDHQASRLDPPSFGKTEAWVILDAEPGSLVYAGVKRGFDRHAFEREVARGTCELCLASFEPRPGDCIFLPAGVVHALGAGLLLAEIQQTSDITYRVYDWNRVGPDGQPRELHIEAALDVIDFERGPVTAQPPQPTGREHVSRLVECDKFILDRLEIGEPCTIGGDDRFHILVVLCGSIRVQGDPSELPLAKGHSMLVPAAAGEVKLEPQGACVLIDAYLPL